MRSVEAAAQPRQPGVVIYRPADESGASHRRLMAAGCRLAIVDPDADLERVLELNSPVDVVLASSLRGIRLGASTMARLPGLRLIAKYTIGVDDIDVDAASAQGILVTHSPTEANYGGVAEGTVAMMLALLKQLAARDAFVRSGAWRSDHLRGTYLGARDDGYAGIVVGIVGLGRVGRRLADLLAPWKLRIIATDPYVDSAVFKEHGAVPVGLEDLLGQADVVSLHCALTAETRGMIDRRRLGLMRSGAVLINTARGAIVDVDAVCDALDAGRLGGAAFDVLPEEPPPSTARVLATDHRVLLSPHMIAANTGGTLAAAVPWATDACLAALSGVLPERICNPEAIEAWRARFGGRDLLGLPHPAAAP